MKLTDVLRAQHREVLALFAQIECTEEPNERRRLLDTISDVLQEHAAFETEVFYPALRAAAGPEVDALVLEAIEQHHVVELIVAETPELDPEAENFPAKVSVLRRLVERHVDEEEALLFEAVAPVEVDGRAEGADRP